MSSVADLIRTQQDTNRLLKLLVRAVLTSTNSPIIRKPRVRIIRETDVQASLGTLTIQPGQTIRILDLPEKPDATVDIAIFDAVSEINSAKVRHTLTAQGGKNRPFNFNATQAELAGAGFTAPNIFPLWTPLAAGAGGVFAVVLSAGLPGFSLHQKISIDLKNEDTVAATIQSNGLFIAAYEFDEATRNIFQEVLEDTDPEERTLAGAGQHRGQIQKLAEIPADL